MTPTLRLTISYPGTRTVLVAAPTGPPASSASSSSAGQATSSGSSGRPV